ncbi:MAG: hypothetical protein ABIJ41_06160 [Candidatus Omnitrophota bacterium]
MKKIYPLILFVLIGLLSTPPSLAQDKDLSLIGEGQYFSIYGSQDLDIRELLSDLNYNYLLRLDNLADKKNQDPKDILTKTIDALYLEISDILGIHIYSYHGNLMFYPDQASVNEVFKSYFQEDFPERSFYLHEKNTIYISSADLTLGMIAHEMAHAIQSHYFVVPPPPKVQEILSGYVEYNLRKSTGTLP